MSRRDDVEMLGLTLQYLLCQEYRSYLDVDLTYETNLPQPLRCIKDYLIQCRALKFDETPNYQALGEILGQITARSMSEVNLLIQQESICNPSE